jgi:hypothetical protein
VRASSRAKIIGQNLISHIDAVRGFYQTMLRKNFLWRKSAARGHTDARSSSGLAADLAAFERKAPMLSVQKKQYQRPQLKVHGTVECMTQVCVGGPSAPILELTHKK